PLSFTHWKYAAASFATVVKSTPGISMLRAPSLIGAPVAFLPVPMPQTAFAALALPDPTTPADVFAPAPIAATAASTVIVPTAARATPAVTFLDLIHFLLPGSRLEYRHKAVCCGSIARRG